MLEMLKRFDQPVGMTELRPMVSGVLLSDGDTGLSPWCTTDPRGFEGVDDFAASFWLIRKRFRSSGKASIAERLVPLMPKSCISFSNRAVSSSGLSRSTGAGDNWLKELMEGDRETVLLSLSSSNGPLTLNVFPLRPTVPGTRRVFWFVGVSGIAGDEPPTFDEEGEDGSPPLPIQPSNIRLSRAVAEGG